MLGGDNFYFTKTQGGMKVTVQSVPSRFNTLRKIFLISSVSGSAGGLAAKFKNEYPESFDTVMTMVTELTGQSVESIILIVKGFLERCS